MLSVDDNGASLTVDNAGLTALNGAISGTEVQVDVLTMPSTAVTNAGTFAVQATVAAAATSIAKAEDAAHASGDVGVPALTVRQDTAAALSGTDADYQPLITDSSGRLHVNVGNTVTVASHAVTNAGTFATQVDGAALTALQLIDDCVFADDAAFTLASSKVSMAGAIRDDSLSALTAVEGDAVPLRVGSTGALHVNVASGGVAGIAEDSAAAGGEEGVMMLAVRRDAASSGVSADGDFAALSVTSDGSLRVSGSSGTTQYAEDAAHSTGDQVVVMGAVRRDTVAVGSGTDGDYSTINVNASGRLYTSATVDAALPAGTNNIGDVDVLTLPALAAGTNNIGDVDVLSVVPGTGATNLGKAEDAAHSSGDTGVYVLAVRDDAPAAHSGTDGDYESLHVSAEGGLWATPTPSAQGGLSIFRSIDLDETEEEVKATAGQVYAVWVTNTATTTRWLKFYNATAANVTVGTTTPVITIGIPGNTSDDISGNFGTAGMGLAFGTAITVAATTGVADADTGAPAANDLIVNIFYK